MKEKEQ